MRRTAMVVLACTFTLVAGGALAACGSSKQDSSVAANCKPKHEFTTIKRGTLSISTVPTLPYFDFDATRQQMEGVEGDVLTAIARMECLDTAVQVLSGSAGLQAVISNRADVSAGGWYKTDERAKVVGLSTPMYYDFVVLVSRDGVARLSDLKGKKVGTVQGSLFVEPAKQVLGSDAVKQYQLADAVFSDLAAGRIDAAIFGSAQAGYLVKQKGADELQVVRAEPEQEFAPSLEAGTVVLPYPKGNPAIGRALDADIRELRANGEMQRILDRWGLSNPNNFELES